MDVKDKYSPLVLEEASPQHDTFWRRSTSHLTSTSVGVVGLCSLLHAPMQQDGVIPPLSLKPKPLVVDNYRDVLEDQINFYKRWFDYGTIKNYCNYHNLDISVAKAYNVEFIGLDCITLRFKTSCSAKQIYSVTQQWLDNQDRLKLYRDWSGSFVQGCTFDKLLSGLPQHSHSVTFCHFNGNEFIQSNSHMSLTERINSNYLTMCIRVSQQNNPLYSDRRTVLIDFYSGETNKCYKARIGTYVQWVNSIITFCFERVNNKQKSGYPLFFTVKSDAVQLQLYNSKVTNNFGIIEKNFYIHDQDLPYQLFQYRYCGFELYRMIYESLQLLEHYKCDYHRCKKCGDCHKCLFCGEHLNTVKESQHKCVSPFDCIPWEMFLSDVFMDKWYTETMVYIDNQKLFVVGLQLITKIWKLKEVQQIESLGSKINCQTYKDDTKDVSKANRGKYMFGSGYKYIQKEKQNPKFKYTMGVTTNVAPIPNGVDKLILHRLEKYNIVLEYVFNSVGFTHYHNGSAGIESHFDDKTKYIIFLPIVIVRLLSGIWTRFGCGHHSKNPLFVIPFARGAVLKMQPWRAASDWIKHAIDIKDIPVNTSTESFMFRRVYSLLLHMCWQKQRMT